jgi:NADPH-dependent 2,4-dienoyl-CoA reductase/sulfur reductase-like enzyme
MILEEAYGVDESKVGVVDHRHPTSARRQALAGRHEMTPPPVIIGAGPAGIRAAATLVEAGLRPILLDEAPQCGGQIYRQPPSGFSRSPETLYGFEAQKASALHNTIAKLQDRIDYRPNTLVWGCEAGMLDLVTAGKAARLPYDRLILATGATDRVLPFPGWLTPGVFTLGGAQVALKFQGCSVGGQTVFLGTGPLLYLVAYQYLKAGAGVAAVLDTTPFIFQAKAAAAMAAADPVSFAKGLYYLATLRNHGVLMRHGVRPVGAIGRSRVQGLDWQVNGKQHQTSCDAIAFGLGLRSETQLADLAGCRFRFDSLNRAWLPDCDKTGRSSVHGVYLAGDGCGIKGADAAALAGERAALALIEDTGQAFAKGHTAKIDRKLAKIDTFRKALESAFPFPEDWASGLDQTITVCRCEGVQVGQLWSESGRDLNRVKSQTRLGMGRCQGRMCATAAAEVLAISRGVDVSDVGRLRGQAPIKPLPFAAAETGS